jgi:hypothetical protein
MTTAIKYMAAIAIASLLAMSSGISLAQGEGEPLQDMIAALEESVLELQTLNAQIETAPEQNREALVYRRDVHIYREES